MPRDDSLSSCRASLIGCKKSTAVILSPFEMYQVLDVIRQDPLTFVSLTVSFSLALDRFRRCKKLTVNMKMCTVAEVFYFTCVSYRMFDNIGFCSVGNYKEGCDFKIKEDR